MSNKIYNLIIISHKFLLNNFNNNNNNNVSNRRFPFLYLVGTYEWKYESADIKIDKLKKVIRVKKDPESNDGDYFFTHCY